MTHRPLLALVALCSTVPLSLAAAPLEALPPGALEEIIVTATARGEPRSRLVSTVQVIDAQQIAESAAHSVTDLLAAHAAGFFSEWTPGQTSINLRGGTSDGQGKDFRGQVLVLMNGRRAGTANLSKLSPSDVARIEIVRGPASVVYGSQNIGGVINLITRTGANSPGTTAQLAAGSWGLRQASLQAGVDRDRWNIYLGLSSGERDDYRAGSDATMQNTSWERWGATLAAGSELSDRQRLDLALRVDGVYDVGFRGSGGNLFSRDNRHNRSAELRYDGEFSALNVQATLYAVEDVDDFRWASPVIRSAANLPAPGTTIDNNYRALDVHGLRLQPRFAPWAGNELLVGFDWERSTLRSTRFRQGVPGNVLAQVPPQDNDQTDRVGAVYFEDAQTLLEGRLTLRAGLRRTEGRTAFDPTPNLALQRTRSADYEATTRSAQRGESRTNGCCGQQRRPGSVRPQRRNSPPTSRRWAVGVCSAIPTSTPKPAVRSSSAPSGSRRAGASTRRSSRISSPTASSPGYAVAWRTPLTGSTIPPTLRYVASNGASTVRCGNR